MITTAEQVVRMLPPAHVSAWTLWGASPSALHDQLWASRGVQVVRPGARRVLKRGPRYHLLLPNSELLVWFRPRLISSHLGWLTRGRALRVRVVDRSGQSYREIIEADRQGVLQGFRREYDAPVRASAQIYFTADADLAARWAQECDDPRRRVAFREHTWGGGVVPGPINAVICHDDEGALTDPRAWFLTQGVPWSDAIRAFEHVREIRPGVWAHETAVVPPRAKIVAPAWIGAGVNLPDDALVIGPTLLPDQSGAAPPRSLVWGAFSAKRDREVFPYAGSWWWRKSKRAFDIAFSLAMLTLLSPLFLFIALAIWKEDGRPVFFRHQRQSRFGTPFDCIKFRTMVRNADQIKQQLADQNSADGPQFFVRGGDPRILRIGHLLRKTNLDELPQFINVLRGDMSVVGPRPSPDGENQFCPTWREARLSVRPGVTGLWQVRRTREPDIDFQEWIRYDIAYVRRQSWTLDIKILIRTLLMMVGMKRR